MIQFHHLVVISMQCREQAMVVKRHIFLGLELGIQNPSSPTNP